MSMRRTTLFVLCAAAACAAGLVASNKAGLVEYAGAQKEIVASGRTQSVMDLKSLARRRGLYAVGAVEGLDGEITIFDSKPYISKVRGETFTVDDSFDHGAIFIVWSEQSNWRDIPIPNTVKRYAELQKFVRAQAAAAGIDVAKPFPFLVSGTPAEVAWHINVDRTEGKPLTKELFMKSKAGYVIKNEPVDIVGFYSEMLSGVFIKPEEAAIKPQDGITNAIHIHVVSHTGKAAGHIDDLTLGDGMTLRLPTPGF
jgi:acetolactate decarboxylase